jgi:hypothetical protein
MRFAPWICAALVFLGAIRWYQSREIDREPGVLAGEDPIQVSVEARPGVERGSFRLVPRAEFRATVRVLRREDYSVDPLIETHSANWHVIPGSDDIRAVLDELRAGSLVELRGQLVDIEGAQTRMRTSLTRDDTGAGACEILLASSVSVRETS